MASVSTVAASVLVTILFSESKASSVKLIMPLLNPSIAAVTPALIAALVMALVPSPVKIVPTIPSFMTLTAAVGNSFIDKPEIILSAPTFATPLARVVTKESPIFPPVTAVLPADTTAFVIIFVAVSFPTTSFTALLIPGVKEAPATLKTALVSAFSTGTPVAS